MQEYKLMNDAYRLILTTSEREIKLTLTDLSLDFNFADGPYIYRIFRSCNEGSVISKWLNNSTIEVKDSLMRVKGTIAGLEIEHTFNLPIGLPIMEEQIKLSNHSDVPIKIENFQAGMQRCIINKSGYTFPEYNSDRLVAIPFRHNPVDPIDLDIDFNFSELLQKPGREQRAGWPTFIPSMQWASEGWAWTHNGYTFGIFKFNQEALESSVISLEPSDSGLILRFGGASIVAGNPSSLYMIQPGQTIELGLTRYVTVKGDYKKAYYAFRDFLDENGCRFPKGFNPPVHWNELYDTPEWNLGTAGNPSPCRTRPVTYTKEIIMAEAKKAHDYCCESLYLDPGWDTDFGTFLWGEDWLGPRKEFLDEIQEHYGLKVSLHCPLATWMSSSPRGRKSWPSEAFLMDKNGNFNKNIVCLGSKQYLNEASKRLLSNCNDGVVFLMFDGNSWNGGCWNPNHGHSVPYTMEEHVRANIELAKRVHEQYPNVLIEMHDMIVGGSNQRYTPVYYKYGLSGSYDENWGFELMWDPMEDIRSGRAKGLYYYNLACNIPMYLHVDLRDDNEHCILLWWYASTCRHLGIGGTHDNPAVVKAQKLAMKKYRRLERFFKEGEFYGMNEEVHIHTLPDKSKMVINLFNLSNETKIIKSTISLAEIGLDPNRRYVTPKKGAFDPKSGTFSITRKLFPWSTEIIEVSPIAQ
jgi:hypothetical protein